MGTSSSSETRNPAGVIPGPQQPSHMSLPELALALSVCEPGTARAASVEEEMRSRMLRTEPLPRTPPTVAFIIGALVTITGVQVGALIRAVPPHEQRIVVEPAPKMSEHLAAPSADSRKS